MKIGQALRVERLNLGLSQQEMCDGVISRPHYSRVEKGEYIINSENLFQILIKHEIDIVEFYNLIQDTYDSEENKINNKLEREMDYAVNTKNIELIESNCQKILTLSKNEILKLRAIVTLAYFKGELDQLSVSTKEKIKKEFDEGKKWTKRPELLRLFTNTMPLWSQDELDFFIKRLLATAEKERLPELLLERYLRVFANYLATCYERKYSGQSTKVVKFIISRVSSFHLMIYKITAIYMNALINGDNKKAKEIRENIKTIGYDKLTRSWPK